MNKFKKVSSLPMFIAAVSILSTTGTTTTSALSNTLYALTSEDFNVKYLDNNMLITFNSNDLHSKINSIKLLNDKNNTTYKFDKQSSDFKLDLNNKNLSDGTYSLVFNYKESNSESKEFVSPIYIDFPEVSSQKLSITSLNPIITHTSLDGVNKIKARFNLLKIDGKIIDAKILDENNRQIGYLENFSNPRDFSFNLGSYKLNTNSTYYIEYSIEDTSKKVIPIKIPFTYTLDSVRVDQFNTSGLTYTSTLKNNGKIDLTLNLGSLNNTNIIFTNANTGESINSSYDNNGNILLNDLSVNTPIQMDLKLEEGNYKTLVFKTPNSSSNNRTPIPFIKFINSSNIEFKKGTNIKIPIIREDLESVGFTFPNTYLKFVYYDDFGQEISITDEKRISTSSNSVDITVNSNIENIPSAKMIYAKVYTPTKSYFFPFNIVNYTESSKSLSFDVIKDNALNDKVSVTFRPNSSLLSPNESFSENDILIINDSIEANLSPDKKSFTCTISPNDLKEGINSYTLIRRSSNQSSINGEFLVSFNSPDIKIINLIDSFTLKTNNGKEMILNLDINDEFLNDGIKSSLKMYDEFGNQLSLKLSVKTLNGNKYVDIIMDPPNQLIPNKKYTLEFSNGINSFKYNFIYNNSVNYNPSVDLIFNGTDKFTINGLDSIPGASKYEFNIKIIDYYNKNNILYENFSQTYYGEKLTSSSITRNTKNGKYFVDGERYLVEITNTSTGDIYRQDFTFRENNIISDGQGNASSITIPSGSLNVSNSSISFNYTKPSNKIVASITSNVINSNVTFSNGKIILDDLVPNKLYTNIQLVVNFNDGTNQIIKLNEFTSGYSTDNLKNYISDVYRIALTPINETNKYRIRYADEEGFNYWYRMLKEQVFSGPEFIFRVLDGAEFNRVHKNPHEKISALYPIVVNRHGDSDGITFWINEFNKEMSSLNSEDLALKTTLYKMLNEEEPKILFKSLGIRLS